MLKPRNRFDEGVDLPEAVRNLQCSGSETGISQCAIDEVAVRECGLHHIAGVVCQGGLCYNTMLCAECVNVCVFLCAQYV